MHSESRGRDRSLAKDTGAHGRLQPMLEPHRFVRGLSTSTLSSSTGVSICTTCAEKNRRVSVLCIAGSASHRSPRQSSARIFEQRCNEARPGCKH
eukprot:1895752-Rhodomonas_salina.2